MSKTIEQQVEEFDEWMKKMLCHNGIMDDERLEWWSNYNKNNLQERDRIAREEERESNLSDLLNEVKDCSCQPCRSLEMRITQALTTPLTDKE